MTYPIVKQVDHVISTQTILPRLVTTLYRQRFRVPQRSCVATIRGLLTRSKLARYHIQLHHHLPSGKYNVILLSSTNLCVKEHVGTHTNLLIYNKCGYAHLTAICTYRFQEVIKPCASHLLRITTLYRISTIYA